MKAPDVPLRVEFTVEVPGTPEQVWAAIATADGISSWFLPTDLEERVGGAIVTYMGDTDSPGTVTGWEPPRRFVYEEPGWAALTGHPDAPVTPLATEFLVEARSGGTCVVRVVTSGFGTGADWENEWMSRMEQGWRPYFDRLRLYLAHFPGRHATPMSIELPVTGTPAAVVTAMRIDLGITGVGEQVEARGLVGVGELIGEDNLLLRLTAPVAGFLAFAAYEVDAGVTHAVVQAQLFSDDAAAWVKREQPAWQAWLAGLQPAKNSVSTGTSTGGATA